MTQWKWGTSDATTEPAIDAVVETEIEMGPLNASLMTLAFILFRGKLENSYMVIKNSLSPH